MEQEIDFDNPEFILDGEEEDEDEMFVNPALAQQPWHSIPDDLREQIKFERKLDGLLVVGESWNIARICGIFMIRKYPVVTDSRLPRYKGLEDFIGRRTKHIYEFPLGSVGNLTLCALIVTEKTVPFIERPPYTLMVKSYHEAIRRCIRNMQGSSETKREIQLRADEIINIFQKDWNTIGNALPDQLKEIASDEAHKGNFPRSPKFLWILKQLGQSLLYEEQNANLTLQVYNGSVELTGEYATAVHCAYDRELENHVLFWNPPKVTTLFNEGPTEVYNVGLVNGLANLTYMPAERGNISHIQYYSKLFSCAHRDSTKYFLNNKVTNRVLERYIHKLNTNKKLAQTKCDRITNNNDNKLHRLFEGIWESIEGETVARLECVVSKNGGDFRNIIDVIKDAFKEADKETTQGSNPLFDPELLTNIPTVEYQNRIKSWVPFLEHSIRDLADKVSAVECTDFLWTMDLEKVVTIRKFQMSQVAELIVHMLLKGHCSKGYPKRLAEFLDVSRQKLANPANFSFNVNWPFMNIRQVGTCGMEAIDWDRLDCLLPFIRNKYTCENRLVEFLRNRAAFNVYQGNNPNYRSIDDSGLELARNVVDLIKHHQMKISNPALPGEVDLKMLFFEPKVPHRSVVIISPAKFLAKVLVTDGPRGSFKGHGNLIKIMAHLREEITRFRLIRDEVDSQISEMIAKEGFPFRFTYGNHTEYLLFPHNDDYPVPRNILNALRKGILGMNKKRPSSFVGNLGNFITIYEEFSRDFQCSVDCQLIALTLQRIYDKGKVSGSEIPTTLRRKLQAELDSQSEVVQQSAHGSSTDSQQDEEMEERNPEPSSQRASTRLDVSTSLNLFKTPSRRSNEVVSGAETTNGQPVNQRLRDSRGKYVKRTAVQPVERNSGLTDLLRERPDMLEQLPRLPSASMSECSSVSSQTERSLSSIPHDRSIAENLNAGVDSGLLQMLQRHNRYVKKISSYQRSENPSQ